MTLDQLRAFLAVARHLSFREAARELHLTPSAISKQLTSLQRKLDAELYERKGAGVELTEAGRTAVSKIEAIVKLVEELRGSFRAKTQTKTAPLNFPVAAVYSVVANVLPPIIAQFEKSHPNVKVEFHTGNSRQIQQMMQKGQVEIGVRTYRSLSAGIVCEPFRIQSLVFFVNKVHPLAKRRGLTLREVLAYPLVTRSSLSGPTWSHDILKQFCDQGLKYKLALQCNVPMEVKRAVANNIGVALTYLDNLRDEVTKGQFVVLKGADFKFTTLSYITYSSRRPLSPVAQDFLALLREFKRIPDSKSLDLVASPLKFQALKLVAKIH